MEWLQITAEYSNAVLVAILPYFSELVHKLELPVPTPITATQVFKFNCNPQRDQFGGWVVLRNGFEFWFENGYVEGFASPRSYAMLQNPASIPHFYGQPKLNRAEALALARDSLKKLGYDLRTLYADLEPQNVTEPERIGTNVVPYYRFQWENPLFQASAVEVEINAATRTVERLRSWNDSLRRPPPKIAVTAPVIRQSKYPPLFPGIAEGVVPILLPKFSEFAKKMGLPMDLPLTTGHVERVEISNDPSWALKLTNGYWFTYEMEKVNGFFAPNSFYRRWFGEPTKPIGEYLGKWNLTEKEAIKLAQEAIRKAGYSNEEFQTFKDPRVNKPKQVGPYVIPRYLFEWNTPHPTLSGTLLTGATVEVDAHTKSVKYLYFFDGRPKPPPAYE